MEMKQISETTLKIMITMEDLEEHGMELKDFLIAFWGWPAVRKDEYLGEVVDCMDKDIFVALDSKSGQAVDKREQKCVLPVKYCCG